MGMELTARWKCERCDEVVDVKIGTIPEGWMWVGRGELWVDAQDFHVDYKLPKDKYVLCDKCAKGFIRWAQMTKAPEQASSTAPVDSPSDTPVVSAKEKTDVGNRTVAMEDIVPDEELPERNCERDFPHDGHPFIDDNGKGFGCPGIKNGPNLESDLL